MLRWKEIELQDTVKNDQECFRHLFYLDTLIYEDFDLFSQSLKIHLRKLLSKIFYKCGISTINSKLLLVQNSIFPTVYNKILTDILIKELLMRAVVILPTPLMVAIGSGSSFALVIDIGWSLTTIVPVFDYRVLDNFLTFTNRAGSRLHYELLSALKEEGIDAGSVSFRELENAISLLDSITSNSNDELIACGGFLVRKKIFTEAIQRLFFSYEPSVQYEDNETPILKLATDIIYSRLPIDLRKSISSRIIITGGISNLKGFRQTLLAKVDEAVSQKTCGIETLGGWAGASIYSTIMKHQKKSQDLWEIRKV
ncbi:hypothetical protein PMKS-002289 [Pichia membranifaciens]|uniref:Actin n=1 Tax=Pichia membranifaciens TaxID=4926 RepID=A0A1Q2YHE9_9ASCO|nr:hypothetical protein PMKS-002289 [Pichia membranifaciens]